MPFEMKAQFLALSMIAAVYCNSPAAPKLLLVAGGGTKTTDAPALEFKLTGPFGIDFDQSGASYIIEMTGNRLLRMTGGLLQQVTPLGLRNDAPGRGALNGPHSLALLPGGDVLVSDTWNNRVLRINAKTSAATIIAGTGEKGFNGDGGPANQAKFGNIYCVALDPKSERMYLADLDNRRIRAVDLKTGTVSTIAGNGTKGIPKDGMEAVDAPLVDPRAVAADRNGNVYILERGGNALRVVDRSGRIRTVAGSGQKGATGDGGDARNATLSGPKHLCIDRDDNVIIADTDNHAIRKYLRSSGKIVRVAGTGKPGARGIGGPPEEAELNQPHGVCVDPSGSLYIADSLNNRVLRIVD